MCSTFRKLSNVVKKQEDPAKAAAQRRSELESERASLERERSQATIKNPLGMAGSQRIKNRLAQIEIELSELLIKYPPQAATAAA